MSRVSSAPAGWRFATNPVLTDGLKVLMSTATASSAPASMESFADLFEESLTHQEMRPGEVITAEIIGIDNNFVTVNAGLKSESLLRLEEFKNDLGEIDANTGGLLAGGGGAH